MPELVVINKADAADPIELEGLRLAEPNSVVVSARTGEGIDKLLAELDQLLPRKQREMTVLLPYDRGDLVSRAHREGEVLAVGHGAGRDRARPPGSRSGLAAELDQFAVIPATG